VGVLCQSLFELTSFQDDDTRENLAFSIPITPNKKKSKGLAKKFSSDKKEPQSPKVSAELLLENDNGFCQDLCPLASRGPLNFTDGTPVPQLVEFPPEKTVKLICKSALKPMEVRLICKSALKPVEVRLICKSALKPIEVRSAFLYKFRPRITDQARCKTSFKEQKNSDPFPGNCRRRLFEKGVKDDLELKGASSSSECPVMTAKKSIDGSSKSTARTKYKSMKGMVSRPDSKRRSKGKAKPSLKQYLNSLI
jgi:hypothetical protein